MARNSINPMQDIVPKGRSIRNVPLPATRSKIVVRKEEKAAQTREETLRKDIEMKQEAETKLEEDIETEQEELTMSIGERESLRRTREDFEVTRRKTGARQRVRRKLWKWVGIVLGVLVLAFIVIGFFHSATVTVTPRTFTGPINADLTASTASSASGLTYQAIIASSTGSQAVAATGEQQVSTRASGTIVIYNNYSAASQRLIKNTRFQTPEGLIYRISDSITVPGKKGNTPGSVEATVLADEPGDKYNVGLKDFTIPGFKGDPRYAGFYARSKTPLTGGFVGIQKIVAAADRAKAKTDIESRIKDDLLKQVAAKETAASVFYSNAYAISYQSLPDETGSSNQVTVKEVGTITAAFFDKKQLSSALARQAVSDYKGESIVVDNIDALTFAPKTFNPATTDTISFHISGNGAFEWLYDETALKTALKGQPRSAVPTILRTFPMIQKADISIRPFWSGTFPASVDKITVKKSA